MKAFNGSEEQKAERLAQADMHIKYDMLRNGTYGDLDIWSKDLTIDDLHKNNYTACSLGCYYGPLSPHEDCEKIDRIPLAVAKLADDLFEALPKDRRIVWHKEWMSAITPGADLTRVWHQYDYWIVHDPIEGVISMASGEIKKMINDNEPLLYRAAYKDMPSEDEFRLASRAAQAVWEARAVWAACAAQAVWEARAARAAQAVWEARAVWAACAACAERQSEKLLQLFRGAV